MRAKRTLRVLVLVLGFGLLPASVVLATHHPLVSDVVAVAVNPYNMNCGASAGQWNCDAYALEGPQHWHAVIKPGSGDLTSLRTDAWVSAPPLDPFFRDWMSDLHHVACVNDRFADAAVTNFAASVASLTTPGNVSPVTITGECNLTGGLVYVPNTAGGAQWDYWMNANVIQPPPPPTATPSPSPTPAPTATPRPTPSPTATPRVTASPSPTPQPTSSPTQTPTPTASPTSSAGASASANVSASVGQSASQAPSDTPEQSVKGATFSAEPSVPEKAPNHGVGGWPGSVPGAGDVSTKPADLGGSAAAALLMLVAMGFIGELFNNTMEANYDRTLTWWKKSWVGRIGRGIGGLFGGGST